MTEGDQLLESMYQKTKIKALIDFNHREEVRKKIALYTLGILLFTWTVLEFKAILTATKVVLIENVSADVAVVKAEASASTSGETSVLTTTVSVKESPTPITDSPRQPAIEFIKKVAKEKGFKNVDGLLRLAMCESSMGRKLVNHNNDKRKTTDNGLWMINDYWHSEVSYEQAMNFEWSTVWTIDRINAGELHEWNCSGVWDDNNYIVK